MTKYFFLASFVAFTVLSGTTTAQAQTTSQLVSNCAEPFTSTPYDQLEQNQIFILGSTRCTGRFTVWVSLSADAQHSDAEGSEASVAIHEIYSRQGQHVLQTGPDKCAGRPGVLDGHFDHTTVSCHVTRALVAGQQNELMVHFFTNATKNQRMQTWWTYEPGL